MTRFVDTNIVIRHIAYLVTEDERRKHEASSALLRRVELAEETIVTTESVFAEILFVLCSPRQYGLDHALVADIVRPILELANLELTNKSMYLRALVYFRNDSHLDIEDAISAASMERRGISEIWSFDRDFDRVSGIRRLEPTR